MSFIFVTVLVTKSKNFSIFLFWFFPSTQPKSFLQFLFFKDFLHPLFIDSWNAFSSNKLFRFGEFLNISKMPQFVNTLNNFILILVGMITMTISVRLVGKLYMYVYLHIHIAFSVFNPIKVKPIFYFSGSYSLIRQKPCKAIVFASNSNFWVIISLKIDISIFQYSYIKL